MVKCHNKSYTSHHNIIALSTPFFLLFAPTSKIIVEEQGKIRHKVKVRVRFVAILIEDLVT